MRTWPVVSAVPPDRAVPVVAVLVAVAGGDAQVPADPLVLGLHAATPAAKKAVAVTAIAGLRRRGEIR
jgi:hypothetical protein